VSQPLFLLGDGGHAPEVALIARAMDPFGERWDDLVILGPDDEETALAGGGDVALAVGTPALRLRLWEKYSRQPALAWPVLIHPRADVGPSSVVGRGSCISSGAIVTTSVVIEEAVLVNFNVTVGHDCVVGAGTVLNPGVAVSGGCRIGRGCLLGAGAVVLEHLSLDAGAIVGAGAVVTKDVAAATTVVGVPARPLNRDDEQ
jgi:sugar O-acyltransferase (sialic acid O-acetyltransferase NeuD family)